MPDYATDMNETVLRQARKGIFPLNRMREYTANYQKAGGLHSFSEYYTAAYDSAIFSTALRANIVFSQHNLTLDGPFNEFHVIFCRNVLIYFKQRLQQRAHDLFYQSLVRFGILELGQQETIAFNPHELHYDQIARGEKLYRRVG